MAEESNNQKTINFVSLVGAAVAILSGAVVLGEPNALGRLIAGLLFLAVFGGVAVMVFIAYRKRGSLREAARSAAKSVRREYAIGAAVLAGALLTASAWRFASPNAETPPSSRARTIDRAETPPDNEPKAGVQGPEDIVASPIGTDRNESTDYGRFTDASLRKALARFPARPQLRVVAAREGFKKPTAAEVNPLLGRWCHTLYEDSRLILRSTPQGLSYDTGSESIGVPIYVSHALDGTIFLVVEGRRVSFIEVQGNGNGVLDEEDALVTYSRSESDGSSEFLFTWKHCKPATR